jgi:hypothetical protein
MRGVIAHAPETALTLVVTVAASLQKYYWELWAPAAYPARKPPGRNPPP